MEHPYYQASSGSDAPMEWIASLPAHVKRLYEYRGTFSREPALVVIFAEVVCEAFTGWALEELFKKKHMEDLWNVLSAGQNRKRRFQDICNDEVHKTYAALSGDQITQAPFWVKLREHNSRRHRLVHPDATIPTSAPIPSKPEAEESFKAVERYIQHVSGILNSL